MSKARRGSVLATVLMLTMLLAILTAVVADDVLQTYKVTNRSADNGASRYVAYAGIQQAMGYLCDSPTYEGLFKGQLTGEPELRFEVLVRNNRGPGGPYSDVPPDCAAIRAEVYHGDGAAARSVSGMIGTATWKLQLFDKAASAQKMVSMQNGSKTMAFNFDNYTGDIRRDHNSADPNSGYVAPPAVGATPDPRSIYADIACSQFLGISTGSVVEGNITSPLVQSDDGVLTTMGPGGTAASFTQVAQELAALVPGLNFGNAIVEPNTGQDMTGSWIHPSVAPEATTYTPPYTRASATQSRTNFPGHDGTNDQGQPVHIDDVLTPGPYANVRVPAGQTLRLRPGRYYFADEFQVDGSVQVDGGGSDVQVFVGKKMIVNGSLNFQGNPANLQCYFTDEAEAANGVPTLDANGNLVTTGTHYSQLIMNPNARATMVAAGNGLLAELNGARLLGSVNGQYVGLNNNSTIEYDTRLKGRMVAGGTPWKLKGVIEQMRH